MSNTATIGKRFAAMLIDSVLLAIIPGFLLFFLGYWVFLFSLLFGAVYSILLEGSPGNATLGKRAMGIRVVGTHGQGIDYATAFVRYLGKLLSAALFGVGYIMALFSDSNQALHDRLANTYVVNAASNPVDSSARALAPPSGASLVGVSGAFAGKRFEIPVNGLLIGRDKVACSVAFPASSQGISRLHCLVEYNAQTGMFVITDRNSSFGTFLSNGTRITINTPFAIKNGERFYLGATSNMFEVRF